MNDMTPPNMLGAIPTTLKDWETDQEVRWCPGCGDYAILKAVQRTLPELGADPANTVFVSGIGCSSRFPYYIESYGFHTIHGRAPAFATGITSTEKLHIMLLEPIRIFQRRQQKRDQCR